MQNVELSEIELPGLGTFGLDDGMIPLEASSDGAFRCGQDGVTAILATGDRKVECVGFADRTLAHGRSALGYPWFANR